MLCTFLCSPASGCNVLNFALMLHADFACTQQLAWTVTLCFFFKWSNWTFASVETFQICDGLWWSSLISERVSHVIKHIFVIILEKVPHPIGIFFFFHLYSVFLSVLPVFSHWHTLYQLLSMFFFTLTSHQIEETEASHFSPTHLVNKRIHTVTWMT